MCSKSELVSDVSGQRCAALNYECCELANMIECIDAISLRVTKKHYHTDAFCALTLNPSQKDFE